MIFSLDQDAIYDVLAGERGAVRERFEAALVDGHQLRLCATTLHDLAAAFKAASQPDKRLAALSALLADVVVEPFTGEDAMAAAVLAHDWRQKQSRDPPPALVGGGQALNRGWTVVTTNAVPFAFLGVPFVDWTRSDRVINPEAAVAALFGSSEDQE